MTFIDLVLFSVTNLTRNKMRTLLTIAGVVVGIAAIVFLVSLGFGLQSLVEAKIASMKELTQIQVDPKPPASKLSNKTIEKINKIKGVKWISASYYLSGQMLLSKQKIDVTVYALDPKYVDAEGVKADVGKNLKSKTANEIVVSRKALKVFDLAEAKSILGREAQVKIFLKDKSGDVSLKIKDKEQIKKMKIIGISKGVKEAAIYLPIKVLKDLNIKYYDRAVVKTKKREVVKEIKEEITKMGFRATSIKDTLSVVQGIFRGVQFGLGALGMIALLVASIGIFNTMTISLLERTHEIGIMKAIGATNRDVKRMFLFEAAQIGFWGGFWGLAVGWFLGQIFNYAINILAMKFQGASEVMFTTPLVFSIISVVFALIVSLVAGIYPARRAGKLNPIEAMRYE